MEETILERRTEFSGKLLKLETVQVRLVDGKPASREIVTHPHAVCAAVLTTERRWVFVRQYRVPVEGLLLEVPAGKIDPGEEPDGALERELREEIGYVSGTVRRLTEFWATPGFCTEKLTAYLVTDAVLDQRQIVDDEHLEVEQVECAEGIAMAMDGRLCDAKSVLSVLAAARLLGL